METVSATTYHSLYETIAATPGEYVLLSTDVVMLKWTYLEDLLGNDIVGDFRVSPGTYRRRVVGGERVAPFHRIDSGSFPDQREGVTHPIGVLTEAEAQTLGLVE